MLVDLHRKQPADKIAGHETIAAVLGDVECRGALRDDVRTVLNGCALNSKYWMVLTVRDTVKGTVWQKTNPPNTAFQPIQDTDALATCP